MSKGVNKVILIGNLGQEPTISTTTNGVLIANISLAVSESRKDPNKKFIVSLSFFSLEFFILILQSLF